MCDQAAACSIVLAAENVTVDEPDLENLDMDSLLEEIAQESATGDYADITSSFSSI